MVCATSKASDQQSDQSLCQSLEYFMTRKLLTEHHLEFLSLEGGCTGSSESILVKNATLLEITCHGSNGYSRNSKIKINPYKPSVLFVGHRQTVQQPDQTPQNAASDQVLHCLLTEVSFKI